LEKLDEGAGSFIEKGKTKMQVNLIDYTGAGSNDPMYAARILVYAKSTRLTQGEELREKIAKMGIAELAYELAAVARSVRSSWEFVEYKWQVIGVTRAFTHQLVRTRYGVAFAQQAMRVADMSEFETLVPETVQKADGGRMWDLAMKMLASCYSEYSNKGVPKQDCRGVLPTNIKTNIMMKFDLRALADMAGKRDNLRAQDEYGEVAKRMKETVYAVHPWAKQFVEPERTKTPALDAILKRLLGDRSPVDEPEINAALKELDSLRATWG
jgi:flavin-dependent thymidylate synthase